MKKIIALFFCIFLCMGFSVSAAEESIPVTLENLRIEGSSVLGDLVIAAGSDVTGVQVGISYNSSLFGDLTIQNDTSYFNSYTIKSNTNCPLVSFTNEKKVTMGGVFATIQFPIQSGVTVAADDLLIYLLPRDQMTSDFVPPTPPADDNNFDNSGGGGGGGYQPPKKPIDKEKPTESVTPEISYSSKDKSGSWEKYSDGSWKFSQKSVAVSGWCKIDGSWYIFSEKSGEMKTGWMLDNGKWYLLSNSGSMKTGWAQSGGKWYFMNNSGSMKTGWLMDNGKWYFMSESGAMKTGWVMSNNKWYYLDESGKMLSNVTTPDGYYVNQNGVWVK